MVGAVSPGMAKPIPSATLTKTRPVCTGDMVGAVELHGMFGGALRWHYRIESIANGRTTLSRVEPRSVRNPNGTFSTVYEAVS